MGKALIAALLLALNANAYTVNPSTMTATSDGSAADTQAAVNYAASFNTNGWTIVVGNRPGGTYTWPALVAVGNNYNVTLRGYANNPVTTILFNNTGFTGLYAADNYAVVTVQDFSFGIAPGGTAPTKAMLYLDGQGVCFVVSNCTFTAMAQSKFGIQIAENDSSQTPGPYGLITHCYWPLPTADTVNCINVIASGDQLHYNWTQPSTWGTTNSVVIEDCLFSLPDASITGAAVEAYGGADITIRHCTTINIPYSFHGFNSGGHDSTRQVECYNNTMEFPDPMHEAPYAFLLRGGSAYFYNNTITTSGQNLAQGVTLWNECASPANWQAESCAKLLLYPADYPSFQQVGQGPNPTLGPAYNPVRIWNNTIPSTQYGSITIGPNTVDPRFISQGLDYFTTAPSSYTPLVYPYPINGLPPGPPQVVLNPLGPVARESTLH